MTNLCQFLKENAKKHKDRIAYEIKRGFRTKQFTFSEVESLVQKTATLLKQKGLTKGDKVAIWAPNMPEYPILYFGCWILGIIAVPLDIRTTEKTIKLFLTKAKCSLGFKGKFIPGSFKGLVKESFYLEDLIDLIKSLPPYSPRSDFVPPRRWRSDDFDPSEVNQNDIAEIAFTSGTTGAPKGVMLTHANFLSNIEALTQSFPFKKEHRALSLLPLSHAFEQVVDFLTLFKVGIKVTYLERINRLTLVKALRKNKITSVALVPQVLQLLINGIETRVEKDHKQKIWTFLNNLSSNLPFFARKLLFRSVLNKIGPNLLFFGCGSAPLNLKLARKWENLGIEIFEGYGATETTAVLTINTPFYKKLGSVGKPLPGITIKIDDKTDEILVSGLNISSGYFEDEEKTNAGFLLKNGKRWYKTGDIGNIDKDGFLYITGRETFRIILSNGQKVYPEDLEKKLNSHPKVLESCVVGRKSADEEVVHAVIITKYPQNLDQIIKEVNQNLSSHEQIMEWSRWIDEDFPRTSILKIDRRKVAETVAGIKPEKEITQITAVDKLITLISQVTKLSPSKIKNSSILATDLKIDSLGRVELLSLIEQEFATQVLETAITPQTTVLKLRSLIKESPTTIEEIPINNFLYSPFAMKARTVIQNLLPFPLHSLFVSMKVSDQQHLKDLKLPAIFYFNHVGIFDAVCALRVLPMSIRKHLVVMVNADIWNDYRKPWVEIFAGGFPFDKKGEVKASLELTGDFLDRGFSVVMAPEGTFAKDGQLLEFKPGIGLLAVEMQVPVIPIKIDPKYREIFPPMAGSFLENLPKKRQKIWLKIGNPLLFPKGISYSKATAIMQQSLQNL